MNNYFFDFDPSEYGVILVSAGIDRYFHNQVFADELNAAFEARGIKTKQVDYVTESRALAACYVDRNCKFFVCFNGFGSELSLAAGQHLTSAFQYYGKPLIDLMHDCPIHEAMVHQTASVGGERNLLMTDYSYAFVARMLGIRNTRFVSSITFPTTLGLSAPKRFSERSIDVLLPIGLSKADNVRARHAYASTHKERVYREIFESVVSRAAVDLRMDPLVEAMVALQEIRSVADLGSPDVIDLISSILDFVKFQRRRDLVAAIQHLPLSVITDQDLDAEFPGTCLRSRPSGSFRELLHSMADAKSVVCPLPHHTGFHERAMGAFCAGAFVVAAPNEVLETHFSNGREMSIYRSAGELANTLERMLDDGGESMEEAAMAGRRKAMDRFDPAHLVSTMLTVLSLQGSAVSSN